MHTKIFIKSVIIKAIKLSIVIAGTTGLAILNTALRIILIAITNNIPLINKLVIISNFLCP